MKKIISLILIVFLIVSCNNQNNTNSPINDFENDKTFITNLEEKELNTPNKTISSRNDFIYALDYLAYYQINEKIYFYIDKEYQKNFYNPYQEYLKAYQESFIANVYPCVFSDDYYTTNNAIAIKLSISKDLASKKSNQINDTIIVKDYDYIKKGDNTFEPIINKSKKIECENGEQLYYLFVNGYNINPIAESDAYEIYERIKEVLKENINSNMSDYEKTKAIYDYLTYEIYYDYEAIETADTYLNDRRSYFLEGVFLDKCAVCDGKAKAMEILLKLCGIECIRFTGKNGDALHAWNACKIGGKWYVVCSTYGQPKKVRFEDNLELIIPTHNMLLTSKETACSNDWGYKVENHLDIYELLENNCYDVFDLKFDNINDVKNKIEEVLNNTVKNYYKIEFLYTGNDDNFQNELIDHISNYANTNVLLYRSCEYKLYEVVFYDVEG